MMITVTQDNIDTWLRHASARFVVVVTDEMEGRHYTLGTYEV